jgi:hypothetical protein
MSAAGYQRSLTSLAVQGLIKRSVLLKPYQLACQADHRLPLARSGYPWPNIIIQLDANVLTTSLYWRCAGHTVKGTDSPPENDLSNLTLDKIENELQLMNVNMAEANDIATLLAFPVMPADLDNDSRKALRRLRDKVMERARMRADA